MNEIGLMTAAGEVLALRGVDVSTCITGLLAETKLVQTYQNDSETNLELTYTFPLPTSATLLSFNVQIGECKLHGEVIPRIDAELAYEKAIGDGNSAFRLQEIRAGMYNASLGNVLSGESVTICITYAETLAWNGKHIRYRLPTTIAPRYGDPTGMQPWQRPGSSLSAEYPLSMRVQIIGALSRSAISCSSHKISMKVEPDALSIMLAKGATMDRDFILEIQNDDIQSIGVLASARNTNVAMLTLLPPEIENQSNHRDVVMVIDCSGSMQGDSLTLAKDGILMALGSLEPNENFGLVAFGTSFLQFDKELQPANRKNLDMARRWVNFLDNLGGTDINGALERALKLKTEQPMDILLLTDGQDWHAGESVPVAVEQGVRIFTMGIGSAVAEDSIRFMADETGGACELVSPTEDMSERIYRHFARMRQPRMSHLDIKWPCEPLWESRPKRACFAGDAYTVFAAFPGIENIAPKATISFDFSEDAAQTLELPLTVTTTSADSLVRIGARQRLAILPNSEQQSWAVRFQLITSETDYLITVERNADEKPINLPELQIQPQMLPAGWGGTSTVQVQASASDIRYSRRANTCAAVGMAAMDFSQIGDIPAVCRKRNVTFERLMTENGYNRFIKNIQGRSTRKLFSGLPKSISGLKGIPLPDALEELLEELQMSNAENEVVLAFYQALLEHEGRHQFDSRFVLKVKAIIGTSTPDRVMVSRWTECLERLYEDRHLGSERYDIPAFLRNQAD